MFRGGYSHVDPFTCLMQKMIVYAMGLNFTTAKKIADTNRCSKLTGNKNSKDLQLINSCQETRKNYK
jgi:hypothetical protein